MKKILIFGCLFLLGVAVITVSSCTDDFEEFNTDPYAISDEDLQADFKLVGEPFINIIQNIYVHTPAWVTQLQQNLIGDVYSGYLMPPTPFAGNSNNMNYNLVDGWNTWAWTPTYQNVMAPALSVEQKAGDNFPEFLAWLKIVKVAAMHRMTDMFGPVIYTKFGQVESDGSILYDCQDVVYDAMFTDLDAGISGLTNYFNSADGLQPFASFDEVYNGDIENWIKLGNSLRLRLAIRISKVDPARAQTEAEAAINHPMGVIETNDQNFTIKNSIDHPMNTINNAWNDVRMGAPMESILMGYNDPRLPEYFRESEIVPGAYKGIRQGIPIQDKGDYVTFSALQNLDAVQLMTASEVYFLRAEGALRGWNMGDGAQQFYEMGITASFDQHGISGASTYMANTTNTAIDYVDPFNTDNNHPAMSNITIAWDESTDFETKLERIMTQKWIAVYPDGQEAWSEYRRTGYPPLFPVVLNNSGGEIDTDEQIKRIKYISGEYGQNPGGVESGVDCLGGADTGGTSLWWDVD